MHPEITIAPSSSPTVADIDLAVDVMTNSPCAGLTRRGGPSAVRNAHARFLRAQTLSASVERTPPVAAACPHFQPVISGMSSPCRAMYSLCSMSLSRIACLA